MFQFTAAHKQLPLGTWVKVTNLRNGRSITVRINDRGPYVGNRIIDLSYGAAQMLDLRARGTEKVRLDVVNGEQVAGNMAAK
jgi:rare lipoprotein A